MFDILLGCFQNTAFLHFSMIPLFDHMGLQKFDIVLPEIRMHRLRKILH